MSKSRAMQEGKKVAVYQPYFFPYIGYWQLIDAVDVFIIGDSFQYIMRGFINRNKILLNHAPHRFTISLRGSSPQKRISEIEILDDFGKFRKMLAHAYGNAGHYSEAMELIDQILCYPDRNLARFLGHQIASVAEYMGLHTEIVYMSELDVPEDLSSREQRLCHLVREVGGDRIINPIGSKSLYSARDFNQRGIGLSVLESRKISYPQKGCKFIPGLSLIDALMHCGKSQLTSLIKSYDTLDQQE